MFRYLHRTYHDLMTKLKDSVYLGWSLQTWYQDIMLYEGLTTEPLCFKHTPTRTQSAHLLYLFANSSFHRRQASQDPVATRMVLLCLAFTGHHRRAG